VDHCCLSFLLLPLGVCPLNVTTTPTPNDLQPQLFLPIKGKAVPLQAWSGPEGSTELRFQDFMATAQDGGKVVSLMHWPPLHPGRPPGTHFC